MVKRILGFLNIALLTMALFVGVKIFYGVVEAHLKEAIISAELREKAASGDSSGLQGTVTSVENSYSEYQTIAARDLFRTKAVETDPSDIVTPDLDELEKTKLELKLWGTITGDAGGQAYAVIEDQSRRRQPQHLYREGDSVGDANIRLILREKVILTVDGEDEVLEMEQLLDQSGRISADRSSAPPRAGLEERSDDEYSIERDIIDDALSDVGNLMRQVRIRPYFKDGNPEGVLLSGIRKGSIFEQMGLQSGDVIKGVNGEPIRSVDDAMALYQGLRSERSVQVQIERDGSSRTISYRID